MYHNAHPDIVALFAREQHEQMRRAAGHARLLRAARQQPEYRRRWRRK